MEEKDGSRTKKKTKIQENQFHQYYQKAKELPQWSSERRTQLWKWIMRNGVSILLIALALSFFSFLLWHYKEIIRRWIITSLIWATGPFDGWTHDEWFKFLPILVAFLGFSGVIANFWQKNRVDNRTEWWKRYIWVQELRRSDSYDDRWLANQHLKVLIESGLVTQSEKKLIQMLGKETVEDNEEYARNLAEKLRKSDLANRHIIDENEGIGGKNEFKK